MKIYFLASIALFSFYCSLGDDSIVYEAESSVVLRNIRQATEIVDYRNRGFVTPVRQQRCPACYAYAAIGSIEGQYFKKSGILVQLSEQQIIDCSIPFRNMGCYGGSILNTFRYLNSNLFMSNISYPITGTDDACKYDSAAGLGNVVNWIQIKVGNETELTLAIKNIGPIAVSFHITSAFEKYQAGKYPNGIFHDELCRTDLPNHSALIVGYGSLDGQDYYIIKNTWGTAWGLNGYIHLARNRNNHCGIASKAYYPQL